MHVRLHWTARQHENRIAGGEQLDEGIGDTLVPVGSASDQCPAPQGLIPSSNCLVLAHMLLCVRHIRIDPVCANERLLRRARWLQPELPKREAREGEYERFAPGLEAACGTPPPRTPPSDANTKPCARRRVLSRRIYPLKIRWSSRARKPVRRNGTRRIL